MKSPPARCPLWLNSDRANVFRFVDLRPWIAGGELDTAADLALQHDHLMSKRGVLGLKPARWPERRHQKPEEKP